MKRFFFLSIFFHAIILILIFSWDIPLAGRLMASRIIEVSLREEIDEKPLPQVLTPIPKKKQEIQEIVEKEVLPPPEKKEEGERKEEKKEEKSEERKEEKKELAKASVEEGEPKKNEEIPPPTNLLTARAERSPQGRELVQSPVQEKGPAEAANPGGNPHQEPGPREGSGTTFLTPPPAPAGTGKKEIGLGEGSETPGPGRAEAPPLQIAKIPPSSPDTDPTLSIIIRKIEAAKRYPKMARKMGIQGTATVRFKLKPNGHLEAVELMESSGSEILDKASIETIRDAGPMPYKEGWLKVGIVFKIL